MSHKESGLEQSSSCTVVMSTHPASIDDFLTELERQLESFSLAKKTLKEQRKELRDREKKYNNALDALEERIDAQSKQWDDVVVRMKENQQAQQLIELEKSLAQKDAKLDAKEVVNVEKSLKAFGYKAEHTAELIDDMELIQGKVASEARQLNDALRKMTSLGKKHKEMLSKWTVEKSLGEEDAKKVVMDYVAKLAAKGEKGQKLAESLKKYVGTSAGSSGAGEEQPQKPTSHTVYVPSSTGAGNSTSGFRYK